ncbi:MAG: arylamine N-acetyltransferase [Nitrospinales bacterium]
MKQAAQHNSLDVDAYLRRIGFEGRPHPSLETLEKLHLGHAFHIPFENLDIRLGRKISLDPQALFDKLIVNKRGGYCHEINTLFYYLLKQLGFSVELLMARVMLGSEVIGPKLHQLLLVETGGERRIADPAFGGHCLLAPLPLATDVEERQFSEKFRLTAHPTRGYILQSEILNQWLNLYSFNLTFHHPVDFMLPNYFSSTSPDSLFTQKMICAKPMPEGRVSLTDGELKIRRGGETVTRRLSEPEVVAALRDHFGIELPPGTPIPQ